MMDEERQSDAEYEVVDRRAKAKEQDGPAPESDTADAQEPAGEPGPEEMTIPPEVLDMMVPPSVDVAAEIALGHMQRLAWEHLGLRPSARTGEVAADLGEARRAIDAVEFLVGLIAPRLDDHAKRDLNTLVSDLKMNYVRREHTPASEES